MQYLLKISYDGTNYYGWAVQPNVPSVCGTIKEVTKSIFGKTLQVLASGRTDRYVHALSLPVLLRGDDSLPVDFVLKKMNELLPNDIRVNDIKMVDDKFQVRFDTKEKKYRYLIDLSGKKNENYYWNWTYDNFDLGKLQKWSKEFIGEKNFASFTAKENYQSFIRNITNIEISEIEKDIISIEITGEGFMRFMVRNIVGALMNHNRGKISDNELLDWLNNPEKGKAHYKAPGSGLYLVEVYY